MAGGEGGSAAAFDEAFEPLVDAAVDRVAARLDAETVELRRTIHRRPELAGDERHTAALVAQRLQAAGLSVTTGVGGHGVVAVLDGTGGGPGAGPTVAYRADLDAVAADEPACPPAFASRVPGAAHLCGHDVHTAVGVGVAEVLARLRDRIRGRIVFVFQPAEETCEGARAMIATGLLERLAPREIYALHCAPLPTGTIAAAPGLGLPGQDRFTAHLPGPAAASAAAALAARLDGLGTVRRPATEPEWQRLLGHLSEPDGPLARYVFIETRVVTPGPDGTADGPAGARVEGWTRAWPDGRYAALRAQIRALVAEHPGARVEFDGEPFPAMVNSPELGAAGARRIARTLAALAAPGDDARGEAPGATAPRAAAPQAVTLHGTLPFNGEDFALFLRRVPGAMFFLGVGGPEAGLGGLPHSPAFDPDERAIGIGTRAMAALLCHRITALS